MRYSRERTLHWLSWLARALTSQNQTMFYLERLQPEWLPTSALRRRYVLTDRLGSGLLVGLAVGLAVWLVEVLLLGYEIYGLTGVPAQVLLGALIGAFFGSGSEPIGNRWKARAVFRGAVSGWLVVGVVFGLVDGVVRGLAGPTVLLTLLPSDVVMPAWLQGPMFALAVGLAGGLVLGLAGGLAGALTGGPAIGVRHVTLVETMSWSTMRAWSLGMNGLGMGFVLGLVLGLILGLGVPDAQLAGGLDGGQVLLVRLAAGLVIGMALGLVLGLVVGLGVALVGGWTGGELETKVRPNQGIRRSARSALVVALVVGPVIGLVFGLPEGLAKHGGPLAGLLVGLRAGALFGLTAGLAFGGYACLSHLALRFVLWQADALPLRTVSFLEYARERIFLVRVGGGYMFFHRLLLEYFAGQSATGLSAPQAHASRAASGPR
jgi:hypothetical protein